MPSPSQRTATGIAAGLAAFVGGYLVTYVWKSPAVEETIRGFNVWAGLLGGDPIPVWTAVAWVFYNAHFVRTRLGASDSMNMITAAEGGSWELLYLVPPLLLLAAGSWVAWRARADDPTTGARTGALVAIGYLFPAVIVALAAGYTVGDVVVRPDPVTATLLAGLVYPAIVGGLGGALAGLARRPKRYAHTATT